MSIELINREREIANGLATLTPVEKMLLEKASDGRFLGGDIVDKSLRSRAAIQKLAYHSTGRLRADVYKMLRGDDAIVMGR